MFKHPPSRTFTLAFAGIVSLSVVAVALLLVLAGLLLRPSADTMPVSTHVLEVLGQVTLSIAACSMGGAGGMVIRDSVTKGATSSGAQIAAAKEP